MRITEDSISFGEYELPFLAKYDISDAMQMVLDFYSSHEPSFTFIFDTYHLAGLLQTSRKKLFDMAKGADGHYRQIELKKRNGGIRILHAPDAKLMSMQSLIRLVILMGFSPSEYATAYVRKRRLADNAAPHVGKRYLLKTDISDFFGSIRFEQVYAAAFNTKHFPKQVGVLLTSLCCYKGVLPQGAPTSPALSNIVMRNFDDNIGKWCKERGIAYTRYSDDMTFSSDKPLYHVYQKVKSMLEEYGFKLNERKTRFVTNASRQCVTGLTVNEKISVPREYKRCVRQEVYYALKFREISEEEKSRIIGKISYILQIEPDNVQFQNALAQMRKI